MSSDSYSAALERALPCAAMERAVAWLDKKAETGTPDERRRARDQKARIKRLVDLAKLGQRLLTALLERAQVDASPLVKFLLGSGE